jgi:hypothetical protein
MDSIKNMTISLSQVDMHEAAYLVEASSIGLKPGAFPVSVTIANTTYSGRKVARDIEGDLLHVEYYAYVQGIKRTLVIYND